MTLEEALKIGDEWKNEKFHRIYFNGKSFYEVLEMEIGLSITRYGTGNISSASLNGEKISNGKAFKMIPRKIYFDVNSNKVVLEK